MLNPLTLDRVKELLSDVDFDQLSFVFEAYKDVEPGETIEVLYKIRLGIRKTEKFDEQLALLIIQFNFLTSLVSFRELIGPENVCEAYIIADRSDRDEETEELEFIDLYELFDDGFDEVWFNDTVEPYVGDLLKSLHQARQEWDDDDDDYDDGDEWLEEGAINEDSDN